MICNTTLITNLFHVEKSETSQTKYAISYYAHIDSSETFISDSPRTTILDYLQQNQLSSFLKSLDDEFC